MLASAGSYSISVTPPLKKSLPFGEFGLTGSCGRLKRSWKLAPPSVDSYSPIVGAPGGVKRPPETPEPAWRATVVPIQM